ncbi:hypothetical protein [Brachybacterium phenoliresistens]|uniref:DUF1795 domain-containing protein n=1 Tax=Brachybacterium phenoliresistens TaxID=396014 RepID=Z9JPA8_9MICO|nr:hypothetical protein [Brachybacterium phenoliresistens]EWS79567.1 hypothetical protein BF93_12995 [Brachybacterium phenoliresistens]
MSTTREIITAPAVPGITLEIDVPESWDRHTGQETAAFVAAMPPAEAGPFADTLVVGIERLPEGLPAHLEAVRASSLVQLHAAVPDLHLVDDRPVVLDGREGHLRALVQSTEQEISVIVRQVFALHGDVLVTIALTSLPFRDREASQLADRIFSTARITAQNGADR